MKNNGDRSNFNLKLDLSLLLEEIVKKLDLSPLFGPAPIIVPII
jgi:hypothetical protein